LFGYLQSDNAESIRFKSKAVLRRKHMKAREILIRTITFIAVLMTLYWAFMMLGGVVALGFARSEGGASVALAPTIKAMAMLWASVIVWLRCASWLGAQAFGMRDRYIFIGPIKSKQAIPTAKTSAIVVALCLVGAAAFGAGFTYVATPIFALTTILAVIVMHFDMKSTELTDHEIVPTEVLDALAYSLDPDALQELTERIATAPTFCMTDLRKWAADWNERAFLVKKHQLDQSKMQMLNEHASKLVNK
jgi:hypothetical protein